MEGWHDLNRLQIRWRKRETQLSQKIPQRLQEQLEQVDHLSFYEAWYHEEQDSAEWDIQPIEWYWEEAH